MAGGCFGLCRLLRRKRKNRRGPGAGPAQEAEEEVQHFQPLQQDPGRDRPEEQDRARGRLRRAVQRLLKFMGVRRRTATTAPPELPAQSDTSAAELEVEPDVSTAESDCAASGDMAPTHVKATLDMAVIDCTETTDMAAMDCAATGDMAPVIGTDSAEMAQLEGTATTDTAAQPAAEPDGSTAPSDCAASGDVAPMDCAASGDMALNDGTATSDMAASDCTATCVMAPTDGTDTAEMAQLDTDTSSDTAPTDVGAKSEDTTEGIASTGCTSTPALLSAFQVLDYLDVNTCPDSVLQILARHLQSQCPERRRLALRGLLVLSVDPSMAKDICSLSEPLLELLRDGDGELVAMTLSVFRNVLRDGDNSDGFSSTAPRLAEALRPVFDHDNSHVQLLSIRLFREVMEVLVEEGTEPWEMQVRQSLVPLFFRWHDENQRVAEAAREALLWAASFLHRKDLEQLLETEQPFKFCDCLMEKDRSRRGEHLQQALPYLQSPQEPLREAAVRFMGVAGWHMREWQQDLWPILKGLTAMSEDDCPSVSNMRAALVATYSRAMRAPPAPLRRPMSLQQPPTTAQGPLLSAAAAPADAGPN
ncbi:uncharacterized protein LOC127463151 [Manacus candei]|uniref:uncharacterized protein LOC127463151 n=1 Tax=Manacus candei TaxID=415023 RepID=UPI0022262C92|nr:uncharacterized protein LOC127463151 [Manacus candei]